PRVLKKQSNSCAQGGGDELHACFHAATVVRRMQTRFKQYAIAAVLTCGIALPVNLYSAQAPHAHAPAKKKGAAAEQPFGREGDPRKVKRTIKVEMSDTMRYFPDAIRVKRGDTVRFSVHNGGQMAHEMVLGTMD